AGISFQDASSARIGAGARIGTEIHSDTMTTELSVLGKVWNEFGGPNTAVVTSGGATLTATDDTSGVFGELAATAAVKSVEGNMSGFVTLGGKFGAVQTSYDAKAGLRVGF